MRRSAPREGEPIDRSNRFTIAPKDLSGSTSGPGNQQTALEMPAKMQSARRTARVRWQPGAADSRGEALSRATFRPRSVVERFGLGAFEERIDAFDKLLRPLGESFTFSAGSTRCSLCDLFLLTQSSVFFGQLLLRLAQ